MANVTWVRFLSRVSPLVNIPGVAVSEVLVANFTHVLFLFYARPRVYHFSDVGEPLDTYVAQERVFHRNVSASASANH